MEDFAADACKTVVAQICEAVGFHALTQSASDTLSDVLAKYLTEVGHNSHSSAELAGRTETNFLDAKMAVGDMGATLPELHRFMQKNELRYAKPDIQFPVVQAPKPRSRFGAEDTEPLPEHIPSFLPRFPPMHTYKFTAPGGPSVGDARAAKKRKNKQVRMIEGSLLNLNEAERKPDGKSKFGDTDDVKDMSTSNKRKAEVLERVSGEGAQANAFVGQAAVVNDLLSEPLEKGSGLSSASLVNPGATGMGLEGAGGSKAFSLCVGEVSEGMGVRDGGDSSMMGSGGDAARDKRKQKALRILQTDHAQDGLAVDKGDKGEKDDDARSPYQGSPFEGD